MRREDVMPDEAPVKKRRPKASRVVGAPIGDDRRQGCPMCAREGKLSPVVYGKDRCINHLAQQAEGMQAEKIMQTKPVKTRTKSRGALS